MTDITNDDRAILDEIAGEGCIQGMTDGWMWADEDKAATIIARHRIEREKRLVEALRKLEQAESEYESCHDLDGGDSISTAEAWDTLRLRGRDARSLLTELGYTEDP